MLSRGKAEAGAAGAEERRAGARLGIPRQPSLDRAAIQRRVEELQWYHTFELLPGLETPGWFDLRRDVRKFPFPRSLSGKRCLDIGTFDGFWAFEMERRGGDVRAIDVLDPFEWDWPADADETTIAAINERKRRGSGFEVAREAFGSSVRRHERSVYDLDPSELGTFDFIYLGSLLLHLRDPVRALMRVREVCSGTFILCDAIDLFKSVIFRKEPAASLDARGRPWWWRPNVAGLERMVDAAGFRRIGQTKRVRLTPGRGQPPPPVRVAALRSRPAREQIAHARFGDPHAIIVAEAASP